MYPYLFIHGHSKSWFIVKTTLVNDNTERYFKGQQQNKKKNRLNRMVNKTMRYLNE